MNGEHPSVKELDLVGTMGKNHNGEYPEIREAILDEPALQYFQE
jgi:hypothetical protein